MTMADIDLYRRFRLHIGYDRCRRFCEILRYRQRLTYWMQDAWAEFRSIVPDAPSVDGDIFAAFDFCQLHERELEPGTASVSYGLVRYKPEYRLALNALFQNALTGVLGGCCIDDTSPSEVSVMYCPDCRSAEAEWRAGRKLANGE